MVAYRGFGFQNMFVAWGVDSPTTVKASSGIFDLVFNPLRSFQGATHGEITTECDTCEIEKFDVLGLCYACKTALREYYALLSIYALILHSLIARQS